MSPRIGIDYLPAVCHAPGVGRYARELVRALVQLEACPQLALFEVGGGERLFDDAALGLDPVASRTVEDGRSQMRPARPVRRMRSRLPRRAVELLHRLTRVGADRLLGGVDLFHRVRPDYPPVSRALELLPVPELPARGSSADERLARALERADDALVFSDHYRREVARRYGLSSERVHRVPIGCDHWLRDLAHRTPEASARPRLLVLGAVRRERHHAVILDAFERLRAGGCDAELLLVGRAGDAAQAFRGQLAASPANAAVRWIDQPREADMPALVAGSSCLVHLAEDEGTAVTPLEAFAMGLDVVASRLPAFAEALGEQALLLEDGPPVVERLADALACAIERRGPRLADARRARAAEFSWRENARLTIDVWQRMLERRN